MLKQTAISVLGVNFIVNLCAATFECSRHIHIHDELYPTDILCVADFHIRIFPLLSSSSSSSAFCCMCMLPNPWTKNRRTFLMHKLLTQTPKRYSYSHDVFVSFSFFVCLLFTQFSLGFYVLCHCCTAGLQPDGGHNSRAHSFYCEKFKFT